MQLINKRVPRRVKNMDIVFTNNVINTVIISYIMNGTETWNYSMLRRLYRLFGKSKEHQQFLDCARIYFFDIMFRRYNVKDLYSLLRKKISTQFKSHTEVFNVFTDAFNHNEPCVHIDWITNKVDRCIARYMALYNGYLYLCVSKVQYNLPGDAYEKIHESPAYKNQVIKYEFLCRNRIHDLNFYDLVIDSPCQQKRAYRLKHDVSIKGIGTTIDFQLVDCIKVLYNR